MYLKRGAYFRFSLDNFLAFILAKTSCEKNSPERDNEWRLGGLAVNISNFGTERDNK